MKNAVEFRAWDEGSNRFLFFTLRVALSGQLQEFDWCRETEIQQCIGVKDKHGRPIFEGDLLRTPQQSTCEVVWSPPEFWIRCLETGASRIKLPSFLKLCEVTGNNAILPIPHVGQNPFVPSLQEP